MEMEDGRRFGDIAVRRNIQRTAKFETTHESSVSVEVNIDGAGHTIVSRRSSVLII